ncbi:MAG: hypothetical protein IJE74_00280 [Clostridia bacterium]|nr:hypothetical protein [Clostridia bacterium]
MKKRLKNTDFLFVTALCFGLLLLGIFIFIYPYAPDETFYLTVPFRLVNGDSLVQDEWHLTQFSSLFSYLPMRIWFDLKGSAEGIVVFSRCVYLSIHTSLTVLIYVFFRKYKIWAVAAAIMYFTQATHRFLSISYHSMFVVFLLLLSLCIISIHNRGNTRFYIFAGICYGLCCICNPFFCIAFALYIIVFLFWSGKHPPKKALINSTSDNSSKTEKAVYNQKQTDVFCNTKNYNCFFTKKAVVYISVGILIIAVFAVAFFLFTGGTFSSLFNNINNLLMSSEYKVESSFLKKTITNLINADFYFNKLSFGMSYFLPILYILLFIDGNRKVNSHRCFYLLFSLILSIMYMVSMFYNYDSSAFNVVELPFAIFSTVSYILTDKKNKKLFNFMWIPCLIGALFQFFASNAHLVAISVVFITNNVAGVFFVGDLFKEMRQKPTEEFSKKKKAVVVGRSVLCIGLCLQIVFHGLFYQYKQWPGKDAVKATVGPFSGVYMTEKQYDDYTKSIDDLDLIKNRCTEKSPVLILSYHNWMYMYIEQPVASYTAWYSEEFHQDLLMTYYKENPDKIPEYIYIDSTEYDNKYDPDFKKNIMVIANELFDFTKEDLSNGVLLTVRNFKHN